LITSGEFPLQPLKRQPLLSFGAAEFEPEKKNNVPYGVVGYFSGVLEKANGRMPEPVQDFESHLYNFLLNLSS
jgi:hypothetical protein